MNASTTLNRLLASQYPYKAGGHENPLVRALYWKRRMWAADAEIDGIGTDVEYRDLRGAAMDDYLEAKERHRHIISTEWRCRQMVRGYVREVA